MYTGPHLIKDNLAFGYDTGYSVADNHTATRFFLGKNTSNTWNKNTHSYTSGDITATRNATPPVPPPSEVQGFEVYKLVSNDGGLNQGIMGTSQVVNGVGGNYIHSVYCYLESGTTVTVGQHWHPWAYGSSQTPPLGKWVRLSEAVTNAVDNYGNIANAYRTNGTAYFTAPQYELGSIVSPHVDGTRSSTESLIDLKNKSNIDVSNISFDSSGQPEFDGTDDIINTGLMGGRNPSSSPFTIEAIVKSDTTSGNHMWLDATNNGSSQRLYCAHASKGSASPMGIQGSGWSHSIPQDTEFHHYVLVMDGSVARLYNNGEPHSTKNYTSYQIQSINVGGRSGYRWVGKIPIFKIHNEIFTADKVKHNFNVYKNRFGI